jgi:hypothetical protein
MAARSRNKQPLRRKEQFVPYKNVRQSKMRKTSIVGDMVCMV